MAAGVKGIAILGSTGSIGRQALEVVRRFPERFRVVGLSARSNLALLSRQVEEFCPAVVAAEELAGDGAGARNPLASRATVLELVAHPDAELVVMAIPGAAALVPVLHALQLRKRVALASKEAVVIGGALVAREVAAGAELLPVDSEASAIWQCLRGEERDVARLILTASGGPLRSRPVEELDRVTPQEALRHPTWRMGEKVTVDSATLMNKAFEVMEAHWLFGVPWERIEVVVHPQSIVHSLVEFQDGSVKAQLAYPDMRLPLQYALFYPQRGQGQFTERLDLVRVRRLTFEPLDPARYPAFALALEAARAGGTYPAALNAADEVAVELFLGERIGFTDILRLVRRVVDEHRPGSELSLEEILAADAWARQRARELA
ncbi:MAG: 1-deoxy-D-xylulose-5-phosphate reductoisomerase [Chloroflexi bacterium]|nr:1-deoxy-D-xylulose-5-phosphate reductoisomerase [Chloroflexota bacterium]